METQFKEIKTDYTDTNGVIHIDGYRSNDPNDEGVGIGYFINGEVYWRDAEFQFDPYVQEVVGELKKNGQDLLPVKHFPNGFDSWQETHFEVVSEISRVARLGVPYRVIIEERGTGGLCELAEYLTFKFEKLNEGREWDGEFFDELEAFLEKELI